MSRRIRFTRHAREKMQLLAGYGFHVTEDMVGEAIRSPARVDRRGGQLLAIRPINEKYALRVVYEIRGGEIVVITLYPVRRDRYGV